MSLNPRILAWWRPSWAGLGMLLLALFFLAFLLYPVSFMLMRAFEGSAGYTLEHFRNLLASPLQLEAIRTSFAIALLTTAFTTFIALPMAVVMARYTFAGKTWLSGLLLVPLILPPFVGAIGLKQLLGRFGSLNLLLIELGWMRPDQPIDWLAAGGFWGIVALQTLGLFPIMYLNLTAALGNLDPSLREAAQNLGARGLRLFRTITLPLILPGYFAGAIIVFIWSFTDLGTPLIFGQSRVVPVQIFDAVSDLNTNPQGYALVLLVLVLTLVLFLVSKRLLAGRRYEMVPRAQASGSERQASPARAALIWAGMVGVCAVALLPHLMVLLHAFSGRWIFSVLPEQWSSENFQEVFQHPLTLSSIRNSLFYSSCSAGLDLVLGVFIAWLLTRGRLRWSGALDAVAMLPLALPGIVLAFGYVAAFQWDIAWLNPKQDPTLLLIISYSVRRLPYIVRSAYAGFQQTSVTLEEASANLGASPLRTLWKITLPLIAAHLIAGTLLTFAFAMLEVSDGLILAMRDQFFPITKMIWQLMGRLETNAPSVACALGVVGMLILGATLAVAARLLGKSLGQLFRS